jgi:membrane protein required for colicin V production
MLIDLLALVLLVVAIFKGFSKGLIVAVFSFLAFLVGLAAALKLSALAAQYIGSSVNVSARWLPVLAFALVFFVVVLLVRLGAKVIERVVQVAMLGWVNRLGGVLFFVAIYGFIYSIVLFYAVQLHLLSEETTTASVVYPWLAPLAPRCLALLGVIVPVFRDAFGQLLQFFEDLPAKKDSAMLLLPGAFCLHRDLNQKRLF